MTTIICWTYEADTHCTKCAEKRFIADALHYGNAIDNEGNRPHPVFSTDEEPLDEFGLPCGYVCGTCHGIIIEGYTA